MKSLALCLIPLAAALGCSDTTNTTNKDTVIDDVAVVDDSSNSEDTTQAPDSYLPDDTQDPPDTSGPDDTQAPPDIEPIDPEREFYLEWFANYNAGKSTEYLADTGVVFTEGDTARYPNAVPHTYIENAFYGPFSRNTMDLYLPTQVSSSTPLVIYFHGGGFSSGDKDKLHGNKGDVAAYLAAGFAVASANYRYGSSSSDPDLKPSIPNGVCDGADRGCRKDYIFRDGARAIQYLRYRSEEFNINPDQIGVWGSSAGGQIAMWIATVPELAEASHPDPVLRESTQISAVGHLTSQVSSRNEQWPELLTFTTDFWETLGWFDAVYDKGLHSTFDALDNTPEGQALRHIVDYYALMNADMPPMITACTVGDKTESDMLNPDNSEDLQGWLVHHPKHSTALYQHCQSVQSECAIATKIEVAGDFTDGSLDAATNIQDFMLGTLSSSP